MNSESPRMNSNLSDPLDKVSVSVRKAVTINRCKEDDLRSMVGHISKEQRRSLNTWSSKQEQFLKTQKRILPAIKLPKVSTLTQHTVNRNNSVLSDVSMRKSSRTSLPPIDDDVLLRRSFSEPRGENRNEDAVNTGACRKRVSLQERNPLVCVKYLNDKKSSLVYLHSTEELSARSYESLPSSPRREASPSTSPRREASPSSSPRRKISPASRDVSSPQTTQINRPNLLSVHFTDEGTNLYKNTAISMPDLSNVREKTPEEQTPTDVKEVGTSSSEESISSWTRLRESLGIFFLDPLGHHKRTHSTPDLKAALENMKECRYLRIPEKITAHNIENSKRCRCVTCCTVRKTGKLAEKHKKL